MRSSFNGWTTRERRRLTTQLLCIEDRQTTLMMLFTHALFSLCCRFGKGKSDKEVLDQLLTNTRYDKRLLPPVDGKYVITLKTRPRNHKTECLYSPICCHIMDKAICQKSLFSSFSRLPRGFVAFYVSNIFSRAFYVFVLLWIV